LLHDNHTHVNLEVSLLFKAERHNQKLIMAFMSAEGYFWYIILNYPDLVITGS